MTDREQKQLYIMLFSNASQDLYPANTLSAFRVELAKPIVLNSNYDWEVGLCEFSCVPPATGTIKPNVLVGDVTTLIYCNIISLQFVGGNLVRCLRTVMQPSQACTFNFETVICLSRKKPLQFNRLHRGRLTALDTLTRRILYNTTTIAPKHTRH
jgi:hypothetical protein